MRSMNLVQMTQLMEKFEQQVGDLDVQTSVMDEAMSATSTLTTPANEVDDLMSQVADEHGLRSVIWSPPQPYVTYKHVKEHCQTCAER